MRRTVSSPSFFPEMRGFRFAGRSRLNLGWSRATSIALLCVAFVGACGAGSGPGGPSVSPAASPSAAPAVSSAASSVASPAAFPLIVTDDEGTRVKLPAEPKRIVSLTAGTTEILFALGAAARVAATDSASDYPAEAVPLPDVAAEFGSVDAEKVVALGADLVIAGGNGSTPPEAIAKLRSLGIPVVVVYASSVDGVLADVRLLGQAVGQTAAGARMAESMKTDISGLAGAVASLSRPRAFYEIDATREIYGPADRSFLAEMVGLAGGVPVTTGAADNFQIPLEGLIAADPQVIVLGDAAFGASPDLVRKRPGWGVMTAVRDGAVRPVDDKLVTRPGPRLAAGLRSLILAIHPDARLP